MSDQADQANAALDQGPLSPAGVAALKIAIVVMGVMIIVGVAVVIGRILYLVSTPSPSVPVATRYVNEPSQPKSSFNLPVPTGAIVQHVALDGARMAVTLQVGEQSRITILDLNTGKRVADIRLMAEPSAVSVIPEAE